MCKDEVDNAILNQLYQAVRARRSSLRFDKDRLAEFSEIEGIAYSDMGEDLKRSWLYCQGYSMPKVRVATNANFDKQVQRSIRKVLKVFFEKGQMQIVYKPEKPLN